jgi:hypothetical protein
VTGAMPVAVDWADHASRYQWFMTLWTAFRSLYPFIRQTRETLEARLRIEHMIFGAMMPPADPGAPVTGQGELRHCLKCHAGPFEGRECPECGDDDLAVWPGGVMGRGYPDRTTVVESPVAQAVCGPVRKKAAKRRRRA